jgi:hypothetical protein
VPDFDTALDDDIGDDLLRLIFTACHQFSRRSSGHPDPSPARRLDHTRDRPRLSGRGAHGCAAHRARQAHAHRSARRMTIALHDAGPCGTSKGTKPCTSASVGVNGDSGFSIESACWLFMAGELRAVVAARGEASKFLRSTRAPPAVARATSFRELPLRFQVSASCFWMGLVDDNCFPRHEGTIQTQDCLLCVFVSSHFHKPESATNAGRLSVTIVTNSTRP